jgi:uncharacterized OB-fold protein
VSATNKQRPIDATLFKWPAAQPALQGTCCVECGAVAFPVSTACKACGSLEVTAAPLPRRGTLWAWTVQRFMPKTPYHSSETPETFRPFGLGYVELPGALRIETRLTENDPQKLAIGLPMELTFYVHRVDPDGTEIINYAFAPVVGESL